VTAWDLCVAARRARAALLIGALATVALVWHTTSRDPVYTAEQNVTLAAESSGGSLQAPQQGLMVAAAVSIGRISVRLPGGTSPEDVSLAGEGVRHGYSVSMRNVGGQWAVKYDRPDLRVQAVGAGPEEVRAYLQVARRHIDEELAAVQAPFDISDRYRIRAVLLTPEPVVSASSGSSSRALAASLALGAALTAVLVIVADRRSRRVAAVSWLSEADRRGRFLVRLARTLATGPGVNTRHAPRRGGPRDAVPRSERPHRP
jgi:hypothetical protein